MIVWQGLERTVTFGGTGPSAGGRYSLQDRGAGNEPRWIITTVPDGAEPIRLWGFTEIDTDGNGTPGFDSYGQPPATRRMGLLTREAITSSASDYDGYFKIDFVRMTDGRVVKAVDTYGRELRYVYGSVFGGGNPHRYFLQKVQYAKAAAQQTAVDVVTFTYTSPSFMDLIPMGRFEPR